MWYPAKITAAATSEPLSVDEVKRRLRVDFGDDDQDIELMIAAARDHAEKYCNTRFATQTVEIKCDAFTDMDRLPEAPVQSIASVAYIDTDGAEATLDAEVYELRNDGLETSIARAYGKHWPAVRHGSRITITAVVGYDTAPAAVKHAILLFISDAYEQRENAAIEDWTALDALLCNFRRGV
ncbi:head-tail connector protein [Rhizobium rhizogenes]|uniref:Phage gp6-like head-tail connector protein n=1 Tax=Rhizobium rhizogenes NBRC 13257 TaxID=1220581 RepID=A0AA87U615_RHIRH|nr:head-tail connector protein [Rhizobium rhizogenes]NTG67274.1 hypothetical protein [Rhizobium rhizogenes]TRB14322.1 hypothetical protein EXN67_01495 [Rhizobium rhizogenes]TRB47112.1 hypothetical protein EXN73_01495 [Rhizobium rhizogenes]TRB64879.1 hypothetical protein EXN71_01495 [Rhizobium rhizogenes]GAJ91033.1 hypothetical protein RRH01S_01_05030 [Rhizobium rhizogenes NBRC 13257]